MLLFFLLVSVTALPGLARGKNSVYCLGMFCLLCACVGYLRISVLFANLILHAKGLFVKRGVGYVQKCRLHSYFA